VLVLCKVALNQIKLQPSTLTSMMCIARLGLAVTGCGFTSITCVDRSFRDLSLSRKSTSFGIFNITAILKLHWVHKHKQWQHA